MTPILFKADEILSRAFMEFSKISQANQLDLQAGQEKGLDAALLDRLELTPERITAMSEGLLQIASLQDPVGEIRRCLEFVDEAGDDMPWKKVNAHPEKNKYRKVLSTEQVAEVMAATSTYREDYGYE